MSEFEKELEKNMELNKVAYAKENFYSDFLVSKRDIERVFHDWQPPKPLVVVPQFVADWFEKNEDDLSFKIWGYLINWKLQDKKSDFFRWMKKESECIEILIRMQDGYTVEKEKKYILKHIDLSEQHNSVSSYLAHAPSTKLQHESYVKAVDMSKIKQCHFTQSEIDKLNIGSYEQIEVKVEEVEK